MKNVFFKLEDSFSHLRTVVFVVFGEASEYERCCSQGNFLDIFVRGQCGVVSWIVFGEWGAMYSFSFISTDVGLIQIGVGRESLLRSNIIRVYLSQYFANRSSISLQNCLETSLSHVHRCARSLGLYISKKVFRQTSGGRGRV